MGSVVVIGTSSKNDDVFRRLHYRKIDLYIVTQFRDDLRCNHLAGLELGAIG
jgi:hypothetical protein